MLNREGVYNTRNTIFCWWRELAASDHLDGSPLSILWISQFSHFCGLQVIYLSVVLKVLSLQKNLSPRWSPNIVLWGKFYQLYPMKNQSIISHLKIPDAWSIILTLVGTGTQTPAPAPSTESNCRSWTSRPSLSARTGPQISSPSRQFITSEVPGWLRVQTFSFFFWLSGSILMRRWGVSCLRPWLQWRKYYFKSRGRERMSRGQIFNTDGSWILRQTA